MRATASAQLVLDVADERLDRPFGVGELRGDRLRRLARREQPEDLEPAFVQAGGTLRGAGLADLKACGSGANRCDELLCREPREGKRRVDACAVRRLRSRYALMDEDERGVEWRRQRSSGDDDHIDRVGRLSLGDREHERERLVLLDAAGDAAAQDVVLVHDPDPRPLGHDRYLRRVAVDRRGAGRDVVLMGPPGNGRRPETWGPPRPVVPTITAWSRGVRRVPAPAPVLVAKLLPPRTEFNSVQLARQRSKGSNGWANQARAGAGRQRLLPDRSSRKGAGERLLGSRHSVVQFDVVRAPADVRPEGLCQLLIRSAEPPEGRASSPGASRSSPRPARSAPEAPGPRRRPFDRWRS